MEVAGRVSEGAILRGRGPSSVGDKEGVGHHQDNFSDVTPVLEVPGGKRGGITIFQDLFIQRG